MVNGHHEHEHDDLEAKKALRPKIERDTKYWLSLEHHDQDPEFLKLAETEFQSSPLREGDDEDGVARRDFLKLMGASIAMASAGCIRRPVQKIVPYVKQPEEVTLGVPNYYTTVLVDGGEAQGLLVKTREGRPIKIEGNASHPVTGGGASIKAQTSVLNLYDPERLRGPRKNLFNEKRTNKDSIGAVWDSMDTEIAEQLKKGSVVVLTGALSGPAQRAVVSDFCQAFDARHVVFEPLSHEDLRAGQKASFGDDALPFYRFDKAKMIVSIDADFIGSWYMPQTFSRQFSMGRKDPSDMSRLVVFDSNYSLTGANADIRVRIKPSQQFEVVMGLLHEIVVKKGRSSFAGNASVKSSLEGYSDVAGKLGMEAELLGRIADDLWQNRGQSLVVAGGLPTRTAFSTELQVAVNMLNAVLENDGKTVEGKAGAPGAGGSWADMLALVKDMADGKVKTLIMQKVNPGYVLPAEVGFLEALRKVEMVISTADRLDETSDHAHFVIPEGHPLENWSDAEVISGVYSLQQPAIRPMYDTRSFPLSLMTWAFLLKRGPKRLQELETSYDYLRAVWREEVLPKVGRGVGFEDLWMTALQTGFVGEAKGASARTARVDAFTSLKVPRSQTGIELVLYPTSMMGDGSDTNASWLHELPDPVTKITWDNYASVSPAFAKSNGIKHGDVITVEVGARRLDLPVNVQPGLHNEVVAVAIGYGRTKAGKVANGIGQNAYAFVVVVGGEALMAGQVVSFKKTGRKYELANPQGHHSMEGRQLVVEATSAEYEKSKGANVHKAHIWSIWSGHQYNGQKWGLAIDLNSCTGCNACVISCQSENNIPVVGKKYVLQGREMAWIRIDRYYVGDPENAEVVFQPVMCQHCDNAPCETVCPVLATVHTDDGLNAMAYNRCVGTRYCSNNCPYKVRRFNWFEYSKDIEKPLHMALNPDVTVRTRGVMEKCSFCVQRIKEARNKAKLEKRAMKDGDVKTACETVCPSGCMTFGDMNDPNSAVSKKFKEERSYALLEEWHAAPAVRYMTKIRNNGKEKRHEGAHGDHA